MQALAQTPVHRFTLENGLQVLVEEDHRKPRVAVAISYGAGTVAEPREYRGIAMLAQRLVYLGSRRLRDGSAVPTLERAGALNFGSSLGADLSTFWDELPARNLSTALWLEADRMAFSVDAVTPALFERERTNLKNEFGLGMGRGFWEERSAFLGRMMFPETHPYHGGGSFEDLDAVDVDGVRWFLQHAYRPDNATLALVGDIDGAGAEAQARRFFGDVRVSGPATVKKAIPVATIDHLVRGRAQGRILVEGLLMAWPGPGPATPDAAALLVLSHCMGGWSSPFEQRLVRQRKVAVGVSAGVYALANQSTLLLQVTQHLDASARTVEKAVDAELAELRKDASGYCKLPQLREWLVAKGHSEEDSFVSRAQTLAREGRPQAALVQDIAAMTPEALDAAARVYLSTTERVLLETSYGPQYLEGVP